MKLIGQFHSAVAIVNVVTITCASPTMTSQEFLL